MNSGHTYNLYQGTIYFINRILMVFMKSVGGIGISGTGKRETTSFAARSTSSFPHNPLFLRKRNAGIGSGYNLDNFLAIEFCNLLRICDRH